MSAPALLRGLQPRPTTTDRLTAADPAFERECVALFSEFLHVLGVPKSVGAIYGLLFASPTPLCFADIVERLGVSKGSVSQGLTFLRQSGAVRPMDGGRREYFEPELGLRRLASGLLQEKIQPLAKESRAALVRLRRQAAERQGAGRKFQLERIKQLEAWHRQLGRIMPVVQILLKVPPSAQSARQEAMAD